MTKHLNYLVAAALVTVTLGSSPSQAAFDVIKGVIDVTGGDKVVLAKNRFGTPGGIFNVDVEGEGEALDFHTFCAELNQSISMNKLYEVQSVSKINSSGARLGPKAAWLYTQFTEESAVLGAGFFDVMTNLKANALQLGIWLGMTTAGGDPAYDAGQLESIWSASYIESLMTTYVDGWFAAFDASSWAGTGDVMIMTLITTKTTARGTTIVEAQDQLFRSPALAQQAVAPELSNLATASSLLAMCGVAGVLSHLRSRRAVRV